MSCLLEVPWNKFRDSSSIVQDFVCQCLNELTALYVAMCKGFMLCYVTLDEYVVGPIHIPKSPLPIVESKKILISMYQLIQKGIQYVACNFENTLPHST